MAEAEKCDSCSDKGSEKCGSCDKGVSPEQALQKQRVEATLSKIKNRIAIVSGKGGVGKSTVAAGIAVSLARKGYRVGVLDADVSGPNMPHLLNVESEKINIEGNMFLPIVAADNIKVASSASLISASDAPVIWRGPMRSMLITQFLADMSWGELDYLIVDLPPGTGDEPLSVMQTIPLSGLVIVSTPSSLSVLDVSKIINMAKMLDVPVLGMVENMAYYECPDCKRKAYIFGKGKVDALAKKYGLRMLGSIPIDDTNAGKDVITIDENSPLMKDTGKVTDTVISLIEG